MKKNIFAATLIAVSLAFVACDQFAPIVPDPDTPGKTDPEKPDPENPDPEDPNPEKPDPDKPEEIVIETEGAVNLGLSVKWAACNVGASVPEEFGGYYGWGETEIRTDERTWKSCIWYGGYRGFTKYTCDPEDEGFDGRAILLPEDDIATVSLGEGWRMPSEEEMRDLVFKCTWTAHELNSVKGFIVTGPSGKSIFMPMAGYIELNTAEPTDVGNSLWFWTGQAAESSRLPDRAYAYNSAGDYMTFLIDHPVYYKVCGMSVRPVQGDPIPCDKIRNDWSSKGEISVSAVSAELRSLVLSTSSEIESYGLCYSKTNQEPTLADAYAEGELVKGNHVHTQLKGLEPSSTYYYRSWIKIAGETHYSSYSIISTSAANTLVGTGELIKSTTSSAKVNAAFNLKDVLYNNLKLGVCFSESKNPDINSNFTEVTAKEGNSTYKVELTGLSEGKTYHYRAVVQADGQVIYGEDKSFVAEPGGEVLKAVDLGLPSGTKWANMNVGAETQTEIGDYFAWGEVTPKERYDTESYKWYDNETKRYNKYGYYDRDYCIEPDDKFRLVSADDAALHNSNGAFRTPTADECSELLCTDYTTLSIETLNGVKGARITSKINGNSIFLPISGYRHYDEHEGSNLIRFMTVDRPAKYSGPVSVCIVVTINTERETRSIGNETRTNGYTVRGVQ